VARLYHGPRASEKPGTLCGRRRSEAQKCPRARSGSFPITQGSPAGFGSDDNSAATSGHRRFLPWAETAGKARQTPPEPRRGASTGFGGSRRHLSRWLVSRRNPIRGHGPTRAPRRQRRPVGGAVDRATHPLRRLIRDIRGQHPDSTASSHGRAVSARPLFSDPH
jgi:hypothetical protein